MPEHVRCRPLLSALVMAAMAAAVTTFPGGCRDGQTPTPPSLNDGNSSAADGNRPTGELVWLDDVAAPLPLTPPKRRALASYAAARTGLLGIAPSLPDELQRDREPRVVMVSLSDGVRTARVYTGIGRGVGAAIEYAAARVRATLPPEVKPRWLRLDVVQEVQRIEQMTLDTRLPRDPSLWGMATTADFGLAVLPVELVRPNVKDRIIKRDGHLNPLAIQRFLRERPWRANADKFSPLRDDHRKIRYRFRTDAVFTDGVKVLDLYRGHRLRRRLTPKLLRARALLAGRYLARAVKADGSFTYAYFPATDETNSDYNLPRHAGTLYSMMQLYQLTEDKELLAAARRALRFLLGHVEPARGTIRKRSVVVEGRVVKLGGVGLAGIAIAEYIKATGDRKPLETLRRLGRWIQSVQNPRTGELHTHYMEWPSGRRLNRKMAYYPGEAILALTRLHGLDPNGGWMEIAESAAEWQVQSQQGKDFWADHWLLYALNEIHAETGNERLARHAIAMANEAIVARQRRTPEPDRRDWVGSFYTPPRITPTATRMEGLAATWFLADRMKRPVLAKTYRETLQRGVQFSLQGQILPEKAMFFRHPPTCLGGFQGSLTYAPIRIDFVQHSLSAILLTRKILLNR